MLVRPYSVSSEGHVESAKNKICQILEYCQWYFKPGCSDLNLCQSDIPLCYHTLEVDR